MEELRVGVIGAGIGAGYIAGFQQQPAVKVTALCARTATRRDPLAQKYQVPHTYADHETMLAHEPLDIVVVATPNHLHHPLTMAVLDAGKHVVCDKPLALNQAEAREMAQRAEEVGVKHFVPFIWRFLPAAAYMKELIAAGFIGQPYHVNVRYYVSNLDAPRGWHHSKELAGSGALGNTGSHAIHLIHWWLGNFRRVSALLTTGLKERVLADGSGRGTVEVDDNCAFIGELESDVPVVFNTSSIALVQRLKLEIDIFGSEGALTFFDDWGEPDATIGRILAVRKHDQGQTLVPIPARLTGEFLDMPNYYTPLRACFTRMAAEVVNAIREDRPAAPDFHDGLRVQEVMDAVLRSASEERWIQVRHQAPT